MTVVPPPNLRKSGPGSTPMVTEFPRITVESAEADGANEPTCVRTITAVAMVEVQMEGRTFLAMEVRLVFILVNWVVSE
jgi:hypothetical protein